MLNRFSKPRAAGAFTLVEMLMVLAIITILIALLLPALSIARKQAATIACQSNQRQMYMAFQNYSEFSKGFYPAPWSSSQYGLGTDPTIPADPNPSTGNHPQAYRWQWPYILANFVVKQDFFGTKFDLSQDTIPLNPQIQMPLRVTDYPTGFLFFDDKTLDPFNKYPNLNVMHCPTLLMRGRDYPGAFMTVSNNAYYTEYTSYSYVELFNGIGGSTTTTVYNGATYPVYQDTRFYVVQTQIKDPSNKIVLMDWSGDAAGVYNPWCNFLGPHADPHGATNNMSNYLFADGHVDCLHDNDLSPTNYIGDK